MTNKDRGESNQVVMGIDRTIHEPARFLILGYLLAVESIDFLFLMNQTGLTRGNLSGHLRKLEDAGYINIKKEFVLKIPKTLIRLNKKGRIAIDRYCQNIQQALDSLPSVDI